MVVADGCGVDHCATVKRKVIVAIRRKRQRHALGFLDVEKGACRYPLEPRMRRTAVFAVALLDATVPATRTKDTKRGVRGAGTGRRYVCCAFRGAYTFCALRFAVDWVPAVALFVATQTAVAVAAAACTVYVAGAICPECGVTTRSIRAFAVTTEWSGAVAVVIRVACIRTQRFAVCGKGVCADQCGDAKSCQNCS